MGLALQPGEEAGRTWSGQFLRALGELEPGAATATQPAPLQQLAQDLKPLPVEEIKSRLQVAYAHLWSTDEPGTEQPGTRPRDPRAPDEHQPGRAMYNRWFRPSAGVIMRESARHTSTSSNKRTQANLRFRLGCLEVSPCSHCADARADALHVCFECSWYEQRLIARNSTRRPPGAADFQLLYSGCPRRTAFSFVQAVAGLLPPSWI